MFHRLPVISVATAAIAVLAFLLLTLSPSSPSLGTAHASHSDKPTVSIKSVMPEVAEEGRYVRVTLKLSRPLTEDEKFCYNNTGTPSDDTRKDEVCIEGGIYVMDNYNDHLYELARESRPTHRYGLFFAGAKLKTALALRLRMTSASRPIVRL